MASTQSWLPRSVFDLEIIDSRSGFVVLKVSGKRAKVLFEGEAGGHRWQRIPPTEKRDRVHTSTITVAVLPEPENHEIYIDPKDLKESFTTGSGPGGQHRNKNQTAVQLLHIPTGIQVRAESEKSQKQNRENAMTLLKAKLLQAKKEKAAAERFKLRKEQVGSGMRGDKIRTIQVRNDVVVDHKTGKRISYKDYSKGRLDGLK